MQMTEFFNEEQVEHDILDEILYRDPPKAIEHVLMQGGVTKIVELVTFADGSQLALSAQVPLPPLADMTPQQITYIKLNGERGERWDDGSSEAIHLARQSIAIRLMEKISQMLDRMPERKKKPCPECAGHACCQECGGVGCRCCDNSGNCPCCHGRGVVVE
jgi:hypothetical protein